MLMPSSVMLIALRGRPLTDELRAVPEVLKPGSDVSESSALRLVSGRLVICCAGEVGRDRRRLRLDDQRAVADHRDVLFERADLQRHLHVRRNRRVQRHRVQHRGLEPHQRHGHGVGAAGQRRDREAAVAAADGC